MELRMPEVPHVRLDFVPECDDEILRRRDDAAQEIDLVVQVAVVTLVDDRGVQDALQLGEIDDVARDRIGLPAQGDLEHVIVPVPVRIRAEAILLLVPLEAFRRVVEPVRGIEMHLARDRHHALHRPHHRRRCGGSGGRAAGGGGTLLGHGRDEPIQFRGRVNCAAAHRAVGQRLRASSPLPAPEPAATMRAPRLAMKIRKALITAANPKQRTLPLQTLVDRDGETKSALHIVLAEAASAGVEEFAVIVCPGDESAYAAACGPLRSQVRFIVQAEARGYGHALLCGQEFCGADPFLHLVGDHLHVAHGKTSCARQLIDAAATESTLVSAVQPTRESLLTAYGAVGGRLVGGGEHPLYQIETVLEKPTPTLAEQRLIVPGLRAGFYLCFFGLHVLDGEIFSILAGHRAQAPDRNLGLSPALHTLAERRRYLALAVAGRRYDIGAPYGLLTAQLALSLSGRDRDLVLTQLVELLAVRAD